MKQAKETFFDLMIGIIIYGIAAEVIGLIIVENKLSYGLGVFYGVLLSAGLAWHMFQGVDKTLDFDGKRARNYAYKMSMIRYGIMAAAVVVAFLLSQYMSLAGVVIGMLALKLAAYMQPLIHKMLTSKIYRKEE